MIPIAIGAASMAAAPGDGRSGGPRPSMRARRATVPFLAVLAALIHVPANVGYAAVFALVAIETMGIPVPAETALIAAALLAHEGQMDIGTLVALAAAAAILGDNVGFLLGRRIGRRVFARPGPFLRHRLR